MSVYALVFFFITYRVSIIKLMIKSLKTKFASVPFPDDQLKVAPLGFVLAQRCAQNTHNDFIAVNHDLQCFIKGLCASDLSYQLLVAVKKFEPCDINKAIVIIANLYCVECVRPVKNYNVPLFRITFWLGLACIAEYEFELIAFSILAVFKCL
jgi:hypothetical protein